MRRGGRRKRPAMLLAFDLLQVEGQGLTRSPLAKRRVQLQTLLADPPRLVQLVEQQSIAISRSSGWRSS